MTYPKILRPTKRKLIALTVLCIVGIALVWGPTMYMKFASRNIRYNANTSDFSKIPHEPVALVFGAGVTATGNPTDYLKWRVQTAVDLYKAHRVDKIVMTGDNDRLGYNEPVTMLGLAIRAGVPGNDIILDYAGFNTYDSCYRATAIFDIHKATIVTQGYHLPRALFTCNQLGLQAIGVAAIDPPGHRDWAFNYVVREWLSSDKSVVQNLFKPQPTVLGKPEPISAD
jgi:vancomycin permeability regulator SanA